MADEVKQRRRRAIDLLDSLRRDWMRVGYDLSAAERADTQAHICGSLNELTQLVHEMQTIVNAHG
ncbi:MAG: hypothetical protein JO001_22415 [Alphaproteobacteria bacterium]|nr:hypothetical protein [Alphaproteobacteria bacterium]